jgi:hypothetical protein
LVRTHGPTVGLNSWLAALLLTVAYSAMREQSWSLDGCLHTLASVHSMDYSATGHMLLRMIAWAWISLLGAAGPLTFAQRYDQLHLLFGVLGVAALTLLFTVTYRRVGGVAAWTALVAVAITRDAERQIASLDEKPLGMLLFALAVVVTDRLFRRLRSRPGDPTLRDVLPTGLAWLLAVFGHLQNAPFAAAALGVLLVFHPGPRRLARWTGLMLRLVPGLVGAGLGLLALLNAEAGGLAALPRLAEHLMVNRSTPGPALGFLTLAKSSLLGYLKAFFLVDRLSPQWALFASILGFGVVLVALVLGANRLRDPLTGVLAGGSLGLMLLIPVTNAFPEFGDSYTMMVMAAFMLLAAAPRAWLAAATALLLLVNLPTAVHYSYPDVTMQLHLARMIEVQSRVAAPWVLVHELTPFDREQGLSTAYYAMSEGLHRESDSLAALPRGPFLLELPQVIDRDGSTPSGRVQAVQRELAARGRGSKPGRLWDPLRTLRSDFRRYGDYLIVEPAFPQGRPDEPAAPH